MARYLAILEVRGEAFGSLIENPEDRKIATEPLLSAIDAEVEHYWFGYG